MFRSECTLVFLLYLLCAMFPAYGSDSLFLRLTSPTEDEIINTPLFTLAGQTVAGAVVMANNKKIPVDSQGLFKKEIHIPDEPGELTIIVETQKDGNTQSIKRSVFYRPPVGALSLDLSQPQDSVHMCDSRVVIAGTVHPEKATILCNGTVIQNRQGRFQDFVGIGNKPGFYSIVVTAEHDGHKITRSRTVKRLAGTEDSCNADSPRLEPESMPSATLQKYLDFTVFDKTPHDTLTIAISIDNGREKKKSISGKPFRIDLLEGYHEYQIVAQDRGGNTSNVVSGTIVHLIKPVIIKMRRPSGRDIVDSDGADVDYTVEFSLENVPDDDPRCITEVVISTDTGEREVLRNLTDCDVDVDLSLPKGHNAIHVEVRDRVNRITKAQAQVEVR